MAASARQSASRILATVGVLFMLAMAFRVIVPRNVALFLGIACFVVAGLMRRLPGSSGDGE